jgi:hypothetical protein
MDAGVVKKKSIKKARSVLQTECIDGVDGAADLAYSKMRTSGMVL